MFTVAPLSQYPYTVVVSGPAADHDSLLELSFTDNGELMVRNSVPINP